MPIFIINWVHGALLQKGSLSQEQKSLSMLAALLAVDGGLGSCQREIAQQLSAADRVGVSEEEMSDALRLVRVVASALRRAEEEVGGGWAQVDDFNALRKHYASRDSGREGK